MFFIKLDIHDSNVYYARDFASFTAESRDPALYDITMRKGSLLPGCLWYINYFNYYD